MPRVAVELPDSSYEIVVGTSLLHQVGPELQRLGETTRVAVVTHPELPVEYHAALHGSLEEAGFPTEMVFVPQGEASKSLEGLEAVYHRFATMRLDRRSAVVALGGGVIGDLAGFAAATYLRGLALVQVPTTLLAQVDASVGGKTAIDLPEGKNLVGAFHQPRLVVADVGTLASLPAQELRSGLAEVVKYGLIADPALFERLEREAEQLLAGETASLTPIVQRSCEIKADVVGRDPHEQGLRAILNYGHTVGHALEAVLGYGTVTHGAAVSIGMSAAARLAVRLGLLDAMVAERQDALIKRLGLPTLSFLARDMNDCLASAGAVPRVSETQAPSEVAAGLPSGRGQSEGRPPPYRPQASVHTGLSAAALLDAMMLDKKTVGGRLRFVLARALGSVELHEVRAEDVAAILKDAGCD